MILPSKQQPLQNTMTPWDKKSQEIQWAQAMNLAQNHWLKVMTLETMTLDKLSDKAKLDLKGLAKDYFQLLEEIKGQ
jgi:hypothetical protein